MIPPKPIKPHLGETDDKGDGKRVHHESLTTHKASRTSESSTGGMLGMLRN